MYAWSLVGDPRSRVKGMHSDGDAETQALAPTLCAVNTALRRETTRLAGAAS